MIRKIYKKGEGEVSPFLIKKEAIMLKAKQLLHVSYAHRQRIDERLYSAFMEHLGDTVYDGIYDPEHPEADENGFRKDVIELVKNLNLPMIRYPGGNYTCSYDWEDGVGPVEKRPARLELAWQAIEPNRVGPAEFEKWVDAIGSKLMMAINMGTRDIQDAVNEVEYFNFPAGTKYADLRCEHGHEKPYDVRVWCVGNENDGPWQIARRKPKEYAWLAAETCKALKRMDESLELVVVGSSAPGLETYGEWDRKVLDAAYEFCDYIALHNYLGCETPEENVPEYLAGAMAIKQQIETIISVCDYIKGIRHSNKTMGLSFDEYNVIPGGDNAPREKDMWKTGVQAANRNPRCYTMENALLYGSMVLMLMKYSDRVRMACQSILINGGGGLVICRKGQKAWVNIHYYMMEQVSRWGRGCLVDAVYDLPGYHTEKYGEVDGIDIVTVKEENEIRIFTVNRMPEALTLEVKLEGVTSVDPLEHVQLCTENLTDANTQEDPDHVRPESLNDITMGENGPELVMQRYSWNVYRFQVEEKK